MTPAEQERAAYQAAKEKYIRDQGIVPEYVDRRFAGQAFADIPAEYKNQQFIGDTINELYYWGMQHPGADPAWAAQDFDHQYAKWAIENNSPVFQEELAKFQRGENNRLQHTSQFQTPFDPIFSRAQGYFTGGEFKPGAATATQPLLASALNQWAHDAEPSGFDKFMDNALPGLLAGGLALATGLGPVVAGAVGGAASGQSVPGGDFGDVLKGAIVGGASGYAAGQLPGVGAAGAAETSGTLADLGLGGASYAPGAAATSATATTGGMFVGSSGMMGGTGNAIIDGALNSAVTGAGRGAITSTLQGGNPLEGAVDGALSGAAFGGVSAALPTVSIDGSPLLTQAANGALQGSLGAGAAAAVTGGDVGNALISGGLKGASMPVVNSLIKSPTLQATAKGALDGGINAGVNGGDILNGAVTGGVGGLGGSALSSWAGFDNGTIGNAFTTALGTVAGQYIGNEIAPAGVPIPAAQPTSNIPDTPAPGTMESSGSIINPDYTGGLINSYQSRAVQRAQQTRA